MTQLAHHQAADLDAGHRFAGFEGPRLALDAIHDGVDVGRRDLVAALLLLWTHAALLMPCTILPRANGSFPPSRLRTIMFSAATRSVVAKLLPQAAQLRRRRTAPMPRFRVSSTVVLASPQNGQITRSAYIYG